MIDKQLSDFDCFWDLYNQSFPEDEKRGLDLQKEIMSHPAFRIRHYKSDDLYQGFINTFHFTDFVFVDHMAVVPEVRGSGIGSSIMRELLESEGKPVLLEVERPVNCDAVRRIRFYESLGFHLNVYDYIQPLMEEGKNDVPLFLMSYPRRLEMADFEKVRLTIYRNVYNCSC